MKRFFGMFRQSFEEITGKNKIICIIITGLLLAVSMTIEAYTIEIPFAKINFAFLAIAAIGMLYGPIVAFFAGGICDVLGFIVHPDGAFLPVYIFIAMLQGLIYGLILYRRWGNISEISANKGKKITEFSIRLVVARLLDVMIINLFLNTAANMHYGFIPKESMYVAVSARLAKNMLQLIADIPLLLLTMPVILAAYNRTVEKKRIKTV